jgi:predicted Zn-dependent protease
MLLSDFYAANNRWPEAEKAGQDAIQADPTSLRVRNSLAQLYLREGNQAKAEDVYRRITQDLNDNPTAVRVLADYYERSGQTQKARSEFQSEAEKYPKNLPLQEGYVRSLLETGDEATALKTITDLVKKNPKEPQILALNGIVLLRDNKPADAENFLMNAAGRNFVERVDAAFPWPSDRAGRACPHGCTSGRHESACHSGGQHDRRIPSFSGWVRLAGGRRDEPEHPG